MLPNWLYGKSKSKLASILGGGGTPTDYNQVKAQVNQNTEDILLLNDDKAALTQITNPNILHNPWFNVNQRGVTSITTSNEFIADRWRVYTTLATFEVSRNSNGYIVIDNSSGVGTITIFQKRTQTYLNSLHDKKVTASVMFSDGSIKSGSITFDSTQSKTYYSDDDYALNYNPTSGSILGFVVKAGKTATIKAAKLEIGSVSTLAMDTAPDIATELLKCQRYFEKIHVFERNILDVEAPYDRDYYITPKRTNGTLTAYSVNDTEGKISFYINNQWEDGDYNQLGWNSPLNDTIRFGARVPTGSFFKGTIVIDAEL